MKSIKELFSEIGNIAYKKFLNENVQELSTEFKFDSSGYCLVMFTIDNIRFRWSVNEGNFVCQHDPYKFDFSKGMEFEIVKKTKELMKKFAKENKEQKIKDLEAQLEILKNEE